MLLAPLVGDKDHFHARRIFSALAGKNFNVIEVCDRVRFDQKAGMDESLKLIRNQGIEVLKIYGADLIIFG